MAAASSVVTVMRGEYGAPRRMARYMVSWRSRSGRSIAWRGVASMVRASRLTGVTAAADWMFRMMRWASTSTVAARPLRPSSPSLARQSGR
jgi:hypothetical protein